jgi:HTH-type transcriptional regulator / antitoxin HipB
MSDFQKYKKKRMKQNPEYWAGYDERFETFKLGVLLKQARLESGLTQEQIAKHLKTTKSVVSRMENHATDIRLSTLEKFAKAVGRKIHVALR